MHVSKESVSLETPVFENRGLSNLGEFITDDKYHSPDKHVERESLKGIINSILETLSAKEKNIIENRFGLNGHSALSLKDIGKKYNLTKERIRQIEKKALARLRHVTRRSKLRNFIEN